MKPIIFTSLVGALALLWSANLFGQSFTDPNSLYVQSGATFTVTAGANITVKDGMYNGGTLTNNGLFYCKGGLNNRGTFTNGNGSLLSMEQSGIFSNAASTGVLNNSGQVSICNSCELENLGQVQNSAGGSLVNQGSFTNAGNLTNSGSGNIENSGTLTNANNGTLTNNGILTNNGGTFEQTGGTYGGSGMYSGGAFVNVFGSVVAPGSSPGCTAFSSGYTNQGTLNIELGGTTACTNHDKVNVIGTATLGGTLNVSLINGYTGTASEQVTIIEATSVTGTFSSVNLPAGWQINYIPAAVILSFGALLPVALTHFSAQLLDDGSAALNWNTASETNNEGFYIERLTGSDHEQWKEIGFVAGHGTILLPQAYLFDDQKPLPGTNYYRLRQVDFGGGHAYSSIVSVEVGWGGSISFFPNPATGSVTLALQATYSGEATLTLYDLTGRQVREQPLSLDGGVFRVEVDLSGLPAGIYFADVRAGSERWQERLVVE